MCLIDEFKVDVTSTVGLDGPAIAGGQGDSVFGCRGGDEGAVGGATRDVERCQPGMESFRAGIDQELRPCEPGSGGPDGTRRLAGPLRGRPGFGYDGRVYGY